MERIDPVVELLTKEFGAAVADDARSLAVLHDRELDPAMLEALRDAGFPECLGLMPTLDPEQAAWRLMADALDALPTAIDPLGWDLLASEYAAIYLNGSYGASPYESVWTSDDHVLCQDAMFEWRALHRASGVAGVDWRKRPDDHLVLQLLYIGHAASHARTAADWRQLATVLDEHTGRWLPEFADRIASRGSVPFYAGLALLTDAWVSRLRNILAQALQEPRPSREAVEARLKQQAPPPAEPVTFMPGTGPSW